MRKTLTLIILGLATLGTAVSAVEERDPVIWRAQETSSAPPRVLALYYGWYGTPEVSQKWVHYDKVDVNAKRIGSHVGYPQLGPYDSTDAKLLEQHVKVAEAAGIQTFVCSWWGKGDQTDINFRKLLPLAARRKMTICPLYESISGQRDAASAMTDLRYLIKEYGDSPGFLKLNGKPVVFVYDRAWTQIEPERWADMMAAIQKSDPPGVALISDGADLPRALVADGLFTLNPAPAYAGKTISVVPDTFRSLFSPVVDKAARFHRIPIVTISPGYDETRSVPKGIVLDRRDGEFYRLQWKSALSVPGAWILINSFNQWHSGTAVEPSLEFGDTYLRITQEMSSFVGRRNSSEKR